jgi:hypothetical protein
MKVKFSLVNLEVLTKGLLYPSMKATHWEIKKKYDQRGNGSDNGTGYNNGNVHITVAI